MRSVGHGPWFNQSVLRLAAQTTVYLRQIGRKAQEGQEGQEGQEPNDRSFDRKLHKTLKRMRLDDVDALSRGVDEQDQADGG